MGRSNIGGIKSFHIVLRRQYGGDTAGGKDEKRVRKITKVHGKERIGGKCRENKDYEI